MEWECSKKHRWKSILSNIKKNHWCPHCAQVAPRNLAFLQELAAQKSGLCLSAEYNGMGHRYLWRCKEGHEWLAAGGDIQQGQWCLICSGSSKHDLEWCRKLASKKSGLCLSTEYINNETDMLWECQKGHRWSTKAGYIRQGTWCAVCAKNAPHDIEWVRSVAKSKGGECLDADYRGVDYKYRWRCDKQHEWCAGANDVRVNTWCPTCSRKRKFSDKEKEILAHVKSLYPDAVGNKRKLLKSPKLELDIYVPSLKCAIEFDGEFWHNSAWSRAHKAVERDARKDAQCIEAGIKLLRIPERDFDADPTAIFNEVEQFLIYDIITQEYLGEGK